MCEYCSDMHICWGSDMHICLVRQQSFRKRAQRSVVFWLRVSHIGLWCQASSIYIYYICIHMYVHMFILSGFAIKSLSYLPELWCHFVIACDPLIIHKKSHKTIYYDSWSAKYIKIERLTDTSCTGFNWVECQINKFPSSAQHIHFWLEHFIVIPIKKKENNFQFYVWKVRRVHSKYLLRAAHSKPKPLKATQRILDTMTDKDRQTDWQIGWYFVGGQNYFASTAAPQTVCVCVDSCTCWGIGHRHRHGHENMSREGERGERGRGERE